MTIETPPAPPRGTRPRNRRALIISAAAELFYRHGYDKVAMSDVADVMNVRPSALYRHFSGKPQLLTAVVLAEIEPFSQVLAADDPLDRVVPRLVGVALDHRRLGVLWQREARALPADKNAILRRELRTTAGRLTSVLRSERPELDAADADLLSWSTWSVLNSVGHNSVECSKGEYESLLTEIIRLILAFTPGREVAFPNVTPRTGGGGRFTPQARREKLLAAAVPLFAVRGYAGVSMEDIGAQAGITGPSVYHYFSSKQDILYAAIVRGDEWLRQGMHRALARATDARDALCGLIDSYVDFATDGNGLIDILISDVRHLAPDLRARVVQTQQDYLGEWQHLLRQVHPETTAMQARARIHAALAIVNDIARTPRLREQPGARAVVRDIALLALLGDHR